MPQLRFRAWVPSACETYMQGLAEPVGKTSSDELDRQLHALIAQNRDIHERECFNLNPATNVMNPKAEAVLASGLGSRPSLGYPGDKYETGLEAIETIEVLAAELAAELFDASYAEVRVGSGALSNLYAFMALAQPGDAIVAPPASIGGHVTHHKDGCAGLYGLKTHAAPVLADGYTVDVTALGEMVRAVKPKVITLGGSLNLYPHPVREVRALADEVGAKVLFDAAHQCGMIASRQWPNPLDEGAHLMTMSTYKSLGGPAGGLIVTRDAAIAERLDAIAYPGLTANFDAAKTAALALSLLDWREHGAAYGKAMVDTSRALAQALEDQGLEVFSGAYGHTQSHQFALIGAPLGGGQNASKRLRQAGFLACGIGLPIAPVAGDLNGLRMGTPEIVRWGMTPDHMLRLADLIAKALRADQPQRLAEEVREWRSTFNRVHFVRS